MQETDISTGKISLSAFTPFENEICKLMERLKLEGIEVVTDGGFRSLRLLEGWEGIRCRDNADSSLEKKLEVTGRIGFASSPYHEDFVFSAKEYRGKCIAKAAYTVARQNADEDSSVKRKTLLEVGLSGFEHTVG